MTSTDPPRTPEEEVTWLVDEIKTALHRMREEKLEGSTAAMILRNALHRIGRDGSRFRMLTHP